MQAVQAIYTLRQLAPLFGSHPRTVDRLLQKLGIEPVGPKGERVVKKYSIDEIILKCRELGHSIELAASVNIDRLRQTATHTR